VSGGITLDGCHYAKTDDDSSLDITGDIDIRAAAALDDWTPTDPQCFVGKWVEPTERSYVFDVANAALGGSGKLRFAWSTNGSDGADVTSSVAPTVSDGNLLLCRVTIDVDNGSGGKSIRFYTKTSTPADAFTDLSSDTGWTQLGSTQTFPGTTSIFASTSPVCVGRLNPASDVENALGTFYSAIVKNGIAGTTVADPDFYAGDLPFTDGAGRDWGLFNACAIEGAGAAKGSGYLTGAGDVFSAGGGETEFAAGDIVGVGVASAAGYVVRGGAGVLQKRAIVPIGQAV
jgi:hypothetical protein